MTATTTKNTTKSKSVTDKLQELRAPLVSEMRRAGGAGVDAYERQVRTITDFQTRLADVINVEPTSSVITAYAELTRDLTAAQISVTRSLLQS